LFSPFSNDWYGGVLGRIGTQSLAGAGEIKRGAASTKTPPSWEGGVVPQVGIYDMMIVIPERLVEPNPESRDSGFDALHRPGMTIG
jgi:hypothetical protein